MNNKYISKRNSMLSSTIYQKVLSEFERVKNEDNSNERKMNQSRDNNFGLGTLGTFNQRSKSSDKINFNERKSGLDYDNLRFGVKPTRANDFDFDVSKEYKNLQIFKDSEKKTWEIAQNLPKITRENKKNLFKLKSIETYADKINDFSLSKEAFKNTQDLIWDNAYGKDFEIPKKFDNFKFDGIINGVKKIEDGINNYIDKRFDRYKNANGNFQLFNATFSADANVNVNELANADLRIGSLKAEIETGVNTVISGIDGKTRGLFNIDANITKKVDDLSTTNISSFLTSFDKGRVSVAVGANEHSLEFANPKYNDTFLKASSTRDFPMFKGDDTIVLGTTVGLNKRGVEIGGEFSIKNDKTGAYTKYSIKENAYYETLVALGVAYVTAGSSAAVSSAVKELLAKGAIALPA